MAAAGAGPGKSLGTWLQSSILGHRECVRRVSSGTKAKAKGLLLYKPLQSTKKKARVTEMKVFALETCSLDKGNSLLAPSNIFLYSLIV